MKKQNEVVCIDSENLMKVLCEIEYMLISFGDMGHYFYLHPDRPPTPDTDLAYALETTRFIDENGICNRLNEIRNILCESFDNQVGEIGIEKLDLELEKINYWRKPGD